MKTLEEARRIVLRAFAGLQTQGETVAVPDAVGRVLSRAVFARLSTPGFHAAAMDGVAVMAETTYGAHESKPKVLAVGSDAHFVNTGHVMPAGTDAVIMIEHVQLQDDDRIRIESPVYPWQHVRKVGEDIVATELLFARNHMVTPYCVGALLTGGITQVSVRKRPRVFILPTGSELVEWQDVSTRDLEPGQVVESNSVVLGKLIESLGGEYVRHPIIHDDLEAIKQVVAEAAAGDFDMVLTLGGSSAGSEDYARHVLQDLGELLVHGVTIMPGKPVLVGKIQGKPFFGMPGYPVSSIIACEQFVAPILANMAGRPEPERPSATVELTRKTASKLGQEEFLRVKLGEVGQRIVATPLPRGAGIITSITEADGIIRIPNNAEGVNAGEPVTAELLRPLSGVANTIVAVGSHDNTLDVLADELKSGHHNLTLSSSHVGSMGGLMALKKGGCHMAGSHLLDTEDGTYNVAYVKRYLPGQDIKLVNLVFRDQGLMVPKGNPKAIRGLEDLLREDVTIINRQAGSGTRILLDHQLGQLKIDPTHIRGYSHDEFTHMAVAVAVLSGTVDVGLGINAAARALDLDFIPVVTEQYDLVLPETFFDLPNIQILMDIINSDRFKNRVAKLGGYHTEKTGQVMWSSRGVNR